jgi:hypothetical protein
MEPVLAPEASRREITVGDGAPNRREREPEKFCALRERQRFRLAG